MVSIQILLNCLVLINAFCENIQKSISRIGNADSATVLMSVLGQNFCSAYCWSAFSPFGIISWNMLGVQIVSWKSIDIRIAASCGRGEFKVAQKEEKGMFALKWAQLGGSHPMWICESIKVWKHVSISIRINFWHKIAEVYALKKIISIRESTWASRWAW